jgi:chromate transporter
MAAAAAAVMLAVPTASAQGMLIVLGGLVGWAAWRGTRAPDGVPANADPVPVAGAGSRTTALWLAGAFVAVVLLSQVIATLSGDPGAGFVAAIVRAGALVFGGGHVVLPLLEAGVVAPGWVGQDAFLAGYGAAQAMPGPLFSFAGFLGAVSAAGPGGVPGAVVSTIAIFLPSALLVLAALPVLGALRARRGLQGALRGANAVVVGILAAALVTPVGTAGIVSPATAVVAGLGALALIAGRVSPLIVVAVSAAVMVALEVAGFA